eukprot:Ihof_evm3s436 gene=Ihof_evmTU3s436
MATEVAQLYSALYSGQLDVLLEAKGATLRLFLPHLVSLSLAAQKYDGVNKVSERTAILQQLTGRYAECDMIHEAFRLDYDVVRGQGIKELKRKQKLDLVGLRSLATTRESSYAASLGDNLGMEFEHGPVDTRISLLISELLNCMHHAALSAELVSQNTGGQLFVPFESDLFDDELYAEEVAMLLPIVLTHLPSILPLGKVVGALLYANKRHTPKLVMSIFANIPGSFQAIVQAVVNECRAVSTHPPSSNCQSEPSKAGGNPRGEPMEIDSGAMASLNAPKSLDNKKRSNTGTPIAIIPDQSRSPSTLDKVIGRRVCDVIRHMCGLAPDTAASVRAILMKEQ